MRNRMKEQLLAGKIVVGAQLRFGSPGVAELFGHAGFDYIVLDSEHAPQTPVGIQHQHRAGSDVGCEPDGIGGGHHLTHLRRDRPEDPGDRHRGGAPDGEGGGPEPPVGGDGGNPVRGAQ